MLAIRRMARTCALTLVTLGATATTLAVAPAHAVEADQRSGAVALSTSQVKQLDQTLAARKQRAAKQLGARLDAAADIAMNQIGDPYSYGAAGPNAFDCSGLVYYSFREAGLSVPRTSSAQAGFTRRVAKDDMRRGDLMFFYGSGGVYHAAIFLRWENGHALMVDSPQSGQRVQVKAPWTSSWFGGTLR